MSSLPLWARYAGSSCLVLVALGVRFLLAEPLDAYPFILFFPAVLLSAFLFDRGTGLYASVLSVAIALYFFVEPRHSFSIPDARTVIALTLFLFVSILNALLVEAMRATVKRLDMVLNDLGTAEAQKTMLLEEMHHRVKNKLAIIRSLLSLHAQSHPEQSGPEALKAAAARVEIIARLHDRLGFRDDGTFIDTRSFVEEICDDLRGGIVGRRPVTLQVSVASEPLRVRRAVPVGLIINELVTNSLKYAFAGREAGTVTIALLREDDQLVLTVSDNGIGLGGEVRVGTGMRMAHGLARQIGGTLESVLVAQGTSHRVRFPISD